MTTRCDICGSKMTSDYTFSNGYQLTTYLSSEYQHWDICDICDKEIKDVVRSALRRFLASKGKDEIDS